MLTRPLICGLSLVVLAGCSSSDAANPTGTPDAGTGGGSSSEGASSGGTAGGGASSGGKSGGGTGGGTASDAGDGGGLVSYSGTVVAGVPGTIGKEAGIAGVSVCIVDATGAKVTSIPCATTDAKGAYTISNLTPHQQLIAEYSKAGYGTQIAAVDVQTGDISRIAFRLVRLGGDGGADGGGTPNFGWDPSVVMDPTNGTVNAFAVQAAHADGGTQGTGVDYTTGVSFAITPKKGDGPFYVNLDESFASGATSTTGGYGGWFLNLPPGTYTIKATHPTLKCSAVPGNGYGWAQSDGTLKTPIIAGLNTQAVGFFCAPPPADAGKD